MAWWNNNNFRMIQNNTRDVDAAMDVDKWIATLKEFAANVAMVGVGGITSFYPTQLEYQVVSPYLAEGDDKTREMVTKCHAAGIRVIGRFDFNRLEERFLADHPDWFFKAVDGRLLYCNDTVTTCINGWYQQEYSLRIIKEALDAYPLDGIFFNAFGFSNWDFYGNRYGVCHCVNCQKAFKAYSAMDLPQTENSTEPAYEAYEAFKRDTVAGVLQKIEALVNTYDREICICTYNTAHLHIVRNESNSGVGRAYPFPLMQSSMNVARVRTSWPHLVLGNCIINATDLRWRYAGVPHGLTDIRLYENIAGGSLLDFCINGVFEDYPDQGSVESAKQVFLYHQRNEQYYGNLVSTAKVALVRPNNAILIHDHAKDADGVFKALKEEHIPFDVVLDRQLLTDDALLDRYQLIILPETAGMHPELLPMLYQKGIKTIALGATEALPEATAHALGLQIVDTRKDNAGAYLVTREKDVFRHFAKKDWVIIPGTMGFAVAPLWTNWLPYRSPGSFGPAERAYGGELTAHGGVLVSPESKMAVIPYHLGEWYFQHGYPDFKYILADLIDRLAPEARIIHTTAHPSVEIFWDHSGDAMLLQMLNLSGFNGTTVEDPLPQYGIEVELPVPATTAKTLNGGEVTLTQTETGCLVTLCKLNRFEAIVLC